MLLLDLDKVSVQFLPSDIVYVKFEQGGLLTSQLIRELNVMSRLRTKNLVNGYILAVPVLDDPSDFHCGICRKAERIGSEIPVAVICTNMNSKSNPKNHCHQFHKPQDTFRIFDNFDAARSWVETMLDNCVKSKDMKLKQTVHMEKPPFTLGDLNQVTGLI